MKRLHSFGVFVVIVALIGLVWGVSAHPVDALSVPTGATINSATLWVYVLSPTDHTVRVHRITAPWTESEVTWNTFNGSFDPSVVGSFVPNSIGWHSADVTQAVKDWATSLYPNHGFLLEQDLGPYPFAMYMSSDAGNSALRPKLEICYTVPGSSMTCVTIQRPGVEPDGVIDAYIWQTSPDINRGFSWELYTGLVIDGAKQSLLQFEFDIQPPSGCSLTPGYWKTHSKYGPASYDSTWDLIGEDTPFYSSGQTYYEVLWTSPRGNAYYILAHAYIAAYLNGLDGADTSVISMQLAHAVDLFNVYSPTSTLSKTVRQDFVNTASVLDQYNNGYIGPGHCSSK